MKNKLYLFAFSFIMMFIGINSANALECYYETLVLKDGTVTRGGTTNYEPVQPAPMQQPAYEEATPIYEEPIVPVQPMASETNYEAFQPAPMPGTISCGGGMIKNLGRRIPKITSTLVDIIKITIPILLVIFGTIDILKGVTSQKEDEIKKGVTSFVKKLVIGVVVFLLVAITQLLVDLITPADSKNIIDCMNCFLNYDC